MTTKTFLEEFEKCGFLNNRELDFVEQILSKKKKEILDKARCISSVAFHICQKNPEDCEKVIDIGVIEKYLGK